jgi:hypothetical protein
MCSLRHPSPAKALAFRQTLLLALAPRFHT